MSAWRRKLLALFPEHRYNIEKEYFSVYSFYVDFLPLTFEAHKENNEEFLRKIYGFSEWCFNQKAKDLWNAAGVSFYEHIFSIKKTYWKEIIPWLSNNIINQCKCLWYQEVHDYFEEFDAFSKSRDFHSNIFTNCHIFQI